QVRIRFPQLHRSLNAVPTWAHAHVHKSQSVGLPGIQRLLKLTQPFLSLKRRVDLEGLAPRYRRRLPEKDRFLLLERLATALIGGENLAKILVNGAVVVDHQDAFS